MKQIKYIKFSQPVTDNGANGTEIEMHFAERYYEVEDTFIINDSKQQCFVVDGPIRKSDK